MNLIRASGEMVKACTDKITKNKDVEALEEEPRDIASHVTYK